MANTLETLGNASAIAVHRSGTDLKDKTPLQNYQGATVGELVAAARPVVTIADLGTGADNTTLTTAQVKGGIITCDMGSSKTVTFPTGANCITDLDLTVDGASIDVVLINTDGSNAFTVAVGASGFATIIGTASIAAGGSATYKVRRNSSTECQLICVSHT